MRAVGLALALAVSDASGHAGGAEQVARRADDVRWCGGESLALTADEARTIALHVRQRAADALPAFCVHPALVRARVATPPT
jgi:hypothetical protein